MDKQRLLYVSGTYALGANAGSELSAHTLLRELARNHAVDVLVATDARQFAPGCRDLTFDGLKVVAVDHESRVEQIDRIATEFRPEAVYTQPWWQDVAFRLGRRHGIPAIFRVVDWPTPTEQLTNPETAPALVIVQTVEVKETLDRLGVPARLLPAFIDLDRARSTRAKSREFVTMFNPIEAKGGFIFQAIVRQMPDRRFAIVPGWHSLRGADGKFDPELFTRAAASSGRVVEGWTPREPDFSGDENVTVLEPRDNVAEIYDRTRLLLVPSTWKEQFARVIFEAAANGAVVIASGMESLRHNAGDAAVFVEDFSNPEAWVAAIRELDDQARYRRAQDRAQDHIRRSYDLAEHVARFHELMSDLIRA